MERAQPQNANNSETASNRLISVANQQDDCSCGRKEKVMFACIEQSCPNRTKQPLYCIMCNEDENPSHNHRSRAISSLNSNIQSEWLNIRQSTNKKKVKVEEWLESYGKLV